jgi:lysophospholipase L1-like esterase
VEVTTVRKWLVGAMLVAMALSGAALAAGPTVLKDMDTVQFAVGTFDTEAQKGQPVGTVQLTPGHEGQANQFSFVEGASGGFFTSRLDPTPAWDATAGLSFWVKGDGSASWGGIELINDDFKGRYAYSFPLDSTEWRKITVRWSDFLAETGTPLPLDAAHGAKPSSLHYLWFGKWYYWRDYPAASYAIDSIALEPTIRGDRRDHTPRRPGAPRTLAKLQAKQPVTIVTVGDSLSDKHHWANREVLWSELLVKNLSDRYGSKVTLVNPAVGGTMLNQGLICAPRWLKDTPAPDLITIWFGYNDFSSDTTPELFKARLSFAVGYLRRLTKGRSEVMLMTTAPAVGRWTEMEPFAQAAREVAAEKRTGLADMAGAFHAVGDKDEAAKLNLYCRDQVHLGAAGHAQAAQTVQQAIAAAH